MIYKIKIGIGVAGKLWTGDNVAESDIVNAAVVERKCSACGATTRRLRVTKVILSPQAQEALEIPTLFVGMGGVGGIVSDPTQPALQCHNWSGRIGGWVVIDPVAVVGGYVNAGDLPVAKDGYKWTQVYGGEMLGEYLLLKDEQQKTLETVHLEGVCPPCRRKADVESVPEGALVMTEAIRSIMGDNFLPEDAGEKVGARRVLEQAHDQRASKEALNLLKYVLGGGQINLSSASETSARPSRRRRTTSMAAEAEKA